MAGHRFEFGAGITHRDTRTHGGEHFHIIQAVAKGQGVLGVDAEHGAGFVDAARLAAFRVQEIHRARVAAHGFVAAAVFGEDALQCGFLGDRSEDDELFDVVCAVVIRVYGVAGVVFQDFVAAAA